MEGSLKNQRQMLDTELERRNQQTPGCGVFVDAYVEMKRSEWDDFHCQITPWERDAYLLNL